MAILAFQKPEKVIKIKSDDKQGMFEFRPLEPGYGITVGNALRRILLSSLEGFAITSVRIEGVTHEFTTIKGVLEDVTNIVLNLKQVRFKQQLDDVTEEKVKVTVSGQNTFKAGDINKFLNGFQVLNPELEICHMESNVRLILELTINKGRGYVPSEENKVQGAHVDTIAVDSIHTPIKNVQYHVENFRVEQKVDYEKLILHIDTDGSITPENALKEAAKILIQHFMLFSDDKMAIEIEEKPVTEVFDEGDLHMRQLLKSRLSEMDLSVRALNCLKAAEVETMGELVSFNKNDLLKFRNFGRKSLTELEDLVKNKGLEFGMNVAKYKIDKD
jgi:DNA-directed RNA polymerase subunit alpha